MICFFLPRVTQKRCVFRQKCLWTMHSNDKCMTNMYRSLAKCATLHLHRECVVQCTMSWLNLVEIHYFTYLCLMAHVVNISCMRGANLFCSNSTSAPWRPQQQWLTTGARYACRRNSQGRRSATSLRIELREWQELSLQQTCTRYYRHVRRCAWIR